LASDKVAFFRRLITSDAKYKPENSKWSKLHSALGKLNNVISPNSWQWTQASLHSTNWY